MSGHVGPGGGMMASQPVNESLQICVPNSAVGAIIGAGGANIKQIMRESGAFVNVSVVIVVLEFAVNVMFCRYIVSSHGCSLDLECLGLETV